MNDPEDKARQPTSTNNSNFFILAPAGRIRDGLESLIISLLHVNTYASDDPQNIRKVAQEIEPTVLILDINGTESVMWDTLKWVKVSHPQTICIVIHNKTAQGQIARDAGADEVLLKGFSVEKLHRILKRAMSD